MKAIVGIVIFGVLANGAGTADPRQVNIALETVVRFDNKDQTPGVLIIDKLGDALEKIKENLLYRKTIDTDVGSRRSNPQDMTFTDFISKAAKILYDLDDTDLEDVFAVIHDESRRYLSRESVFQDLFGGTDVRRHLTEQLDVFGDVDANNLRRHLDKAISAVEHKQKTGEKNDILDIGNLLYIGGAVKFRSALENLERLKTKNTHVEVVLKDTLRSLIFDHYSKLNDKIKRELIDMAKDYWRMYSKKRIKTTLISGLKTISVSHFSHRERNKNYHRNRAHFNKPQMSREQSNESPRTSHKNKTYTIEPIKPKDLKFTPHTTEPIKPNVLKFTPHTNHKNKRYTIKSKKPKNQGFNPSDNESNEFNSYPKPGFDIKETPPTKINLYKMISSENRYKEHEEIDNKFEKYTSPKNTIRPALSYEKSNLKVSNAIFKAGSAQSDIDMSAILVGGKKIANIINTVLKSPPLSEKSTKKPKNKDDIDTSDDTDEKQLTTNKSVVKSTTENSAVDDEDDIIKDNPYSVTAAVFRNIGISVEGLTIESFEDNFTIEKKSLRKSNTQYPESTILKGIIKNIEKQITDVKEQINNIKNLSVCTDKPTTRQPKKPQFKSAHSDERSTTLLKTKKNHHAPDSEAIDRENDAFFLENIVPEKTGGAFRANDDADHKVTVTDKNKNKTITRVSENKILKTTTTVNETKENVTLNTPTTKKYSEHMRNSTNIELKTNNKTDNIDVKDVRKFNVNEDNIRLNEINHKKIRSALENKYDENYFSIPQILNFSTKYELDDDQLFGDIAPNEY